MLKTKKNYVVLALITAIAIMFGGLFTLFGAIKTNVASSVFATANSGNGWSYDGNGKLTITSDDAWNYFDYEHTNFAHYDDLTTVEIGDGVTTIPEKAFDMCLSLTNVTIGKDVREIGAMCFWAYDEEGVPTLDIWLEATKADLESPPRSPGRVVVYFWFGLDVDFDTLFNAHDDARELATALENYDSNNSATFDALMHADYLCMGLLEENYQVYVNNSENYNELVNNANMLIATCSALCSDNPTNALQELGMPPEYIQMILSLMYPDTVEAFLENVIKGFSFNTNRGGLEYKISGDYVGYTETSWYGYEFRPVEIHYDQSIAEEVADVFEDLGESGITLTQIIDTPETGIVLDIILPSVIILLTLITTVCVWKKKEQY